MEILHQIPAQSNRFGQYCQPPGNHFNTIINLIITVSLCSQSALLEEQNRLVKWHKGQQVLTSNAG